jgi:hypothetical protein
LSSYSTRFWKYKCEQTKQSLCIRDGRNVKLNRAKEEGRDARNEIKRRCDRKELGGGSTLGREIWEGPAELINTATTLGHPLCNNSVAIHA